MGRSSIAVDDEIASRLSKAAANYKQTSFALANTCLDACLRICEEGGNSDQIYADWKMNRIAREVGTLQFIGRDLIERLVHELAQEHPDRAMSLFKDAGYNFGGFLQLCFPTIKDVLTLMEQLKRSQTAGHIEFVERTAGSREEEEVYVLTVRSSLTAEFLVYLSEFWRGILSAYGLDLTNSKITELGAARLTFVSHGKLKKVEPQLNSMTISKMGV